MRRKLPPHCESWRDRHGKLRVYFRLRKGEPRIPLPTDPDTEEFAEAYRQALAGGWKPKREPLRTVQPGTVAALVRSYKRSADYLALRMTTKTGYDSRLRMIEDAHGHRTLSGMTRQGVESKILGPFADRPGQRLAILKMLRVLIRHAIEVGQLATDPTAGIRRPRGEEIRAWTEQEIATFEARWPLGTRERTAFALHLYTGQRRSDVHRMTWSDVQDGTVRVIQQKTGARLAIPIHPELARVLAAAERSHVVILATAYAKPFTVDGFSSFMRDAIREAKLPLGCQPHGLRKAAGRRLAEAGCTANEIMAVLGHKSLAEAERYTREANQATLAAAAMAKLDGQRSNKRPKLSPARVGKAAKSAGETE
jgi:integrase